jgi:hypothetical protein
MNDGIRSEKFALWGATSSDLLRVVLLNFMFCSPFSTEKSNILLEYPCYPEYCSPYKDTKTGHFGGWAVLVRTQGFTSLDYSMVALAGDVILTLCFSACPSKKIRKIVVRNEQNLLDMMRPPSGALTARADYAVHDFASV